MKVKLGTVKFEDYVDWWSLSKEPNAVRNPLELLAVFPHVQEFIQYEQSKKSTANRVVVYRKLMFDKSTHPCDLFLNYLLKIEHKDITDIQLEVYKEWFGGFNRYDNFIGFIGWVHIESLVMAMPYVIPEVLKALPIDTVLRYLGGSNTRLFNAITFYDINSSSYQTLRLVNAKLLTNLNPYMFKALDHLGCIDIAESWTKNIFVDKQKRLYLKIADPEGPKIYRVKRMGKSYFAKAEEKSKTK